MLANHYRDLSIYVLRSFNSQKSNIFSGIINPLKCLARSNHGNGETGSILLVVVPWKLLYTSHRTARPLLTFDLRHQDKVTL